MVDTLFILDPVRKEPVFSRITFDSDPLWDAAGPSRRARAPEKAKEIRARSLETGLTKHGGAVFDLVEGYRIPLFWGSSSSVF